VQKSLLVAGVTLALAGAVAIAAIDLVARRAAFETDARIIHRLLSQRVVQHDAILETLAILQPGGAPAAQLDEQCAMAALEEVKDLLK
jgi:hypothetical protein